MNFPKFSDGFFGLPSAVLAALLRRGCHGSSKDSLAMPLELLAIGCLNLGVCVMGVGTVHDSSDTCGCQKMISASDGFLGFNVF